MINFSIKNCRKIKFYFSNISIAYLISCYCVLVCSQVQLGLKPSSNISLPILTYLDLHMVIVLVYKIADLDQIWICLSIEINICVKNYLRKISKSLTFASCQPCNLNLLVGYSDFLRHLEAFAFHTISFVFELLSN
jgi:hypothetical protein